jgi:hypothetical protein
MQIIDLGIKDLALKKSLIGGSESDFLPTQDISV